MQTREHIYDAGLRAARPIIQRLAGLHPKGDAAVRGRAEAEARFAMWGERGRVAQSPVVLVHAPSVGEGLMAQAIIAELRSIRADVQIAFTFFSPSAERIADRVGADVSGYLPIDTRPGMRALVRTLRPDVVAFVRTEIWPMLGIEAQAAGAHVALVNAVLASGSSRLGAGARFLLGPAYRRLNAIGAVSADDGARFDTFGVDRARVHVTGDARFDQVWTRVHAVDGANAFAYLRDHRPLLVAGSTWPADEDVLRDAIVRIPVEDRPRVVFAPHEPTDTALASLEQKLDPLGGVTRLSALERAGGGEADFIIIDRMGVLADAYAAGDIAWVGGGFGDSGLHSIVEPAALGVPVLYGPRHGNAREAGELARAGGGFVVQDAYALTAQLRRLTADATARRLAGTAAVDFVRSRLGGGAANAALLAGLIALHPRFR
ncbi:MAG TPA: glycosyltransferase N-terminal domain-containing protein [Longimicrobiales bacterium]